MARRVSSPRGRIGVAPPATMMLVRQLHAYLTAFVAPTILFFAFTGALQIFSFHEAHGDYKPPVVLEKLAALHKDQKFEVPRHRRPPPESAPAVSATRPAGDWVAPVAARPEKEAPPPLRVLALKILFFWSAVILIVSTLLGLWMALFQHRRRAVLWVLLILGAAAPVAILTLL
jgi:hypothetical protein